MCLAEARARSRVVLRESSLMEMDAKGSNEGRERAFNISARSHGGIKGGHGGCNPPEKSDHQHEHPDQLPINQGTEIAASYIFSMDGRLPLSSLCCRRRKTSNTGQFARLIFLSQHHFTNTPHLRVYRCLIEGARDSVIV